MDSAQATTRPRVAGLSRIIARGTETTPECLFRETPLDRPSNLHACIFLAFVERVPLPIPRSFSMSCGQNMAMPVFYTD